jgi:hypothetical protein
MPAANKINSAATIANRAFADAKTRDTEIPPFHARWPRT